MRKFVWPACIAAVFIFSAPAFAYLSFFGTRQYYSNYFYDVQVGYSQLVKSEITVTPKGSYLDVVEDAWIRGQVTYNYSNMQDNYWLKGNIYTDNLTVLVGLMVWEDGTAYRAQMYPSEDADELPVPDSGQGDGGGSPAVMTVKLIQTGPNRYEIEIPLMRLGETKHIRIRYLLANTGGGRASYRLPVLFDGFTDPEDLAVIIGDTASTEQFVINTAVGKVTAENGARTMIPYRSSFTIEAGSDVNSVLHLTSFENGPWAGNYLHLNTGVPDSVIGALSQKIETVFLWRWNSPYTFSYLYDRTKVLSGYGRTAIQQAEKIESSAALLAGRGHKVGMVHSIEGRSPKTYPLAGTGDSGYEAMKTYLRNINEYYFLSDEGAEFTSRPSWAPLEVQDAGTESHPADEFRTSLNTAVALYTGTDGNLRHLVFLSAGPADSGPMMVSVDEVEALLRGITADASSCVWENVPITEIIPSVYAQGLSYYSNFYFPSFEPRTVSVALANENDAYTFPLSMAYGTAFSITAKAAAPWDTVLRWTGYDAAGTVCGRTVSTPLLVAAELDSGLAKIWAGDDDHLSDEFEDGLGYTYGIVTAATCLRADNTDTVADDSMLPYLTAEEIYIPVSVDDPDDTRTAENGFDYRFAGDKLLIGMEVPDPDAQLTVYDCTGKVLNILELHRYIRGSGYAIPVRDILTGGGARIYFLVFRSGTFEKSITYFVGGLQ